MSTPEKRALRDVPLVEPGHDFASITDKISAVVLTSRRRASGSSASASGSCC
jgi:hypothetical protein